MTKLVVKHTTLCFLFSENALLMILKKRGQGAGKWNVPGGKIAEGESALAGAIRETEEETGLRPTDLMELGRLEFSFPEGNSWDNHCSVFVSRNFSGDLVAENEECSATWVPIDEIPFDKMWESDRIWVPLVLAGKKFHRAYVFDAKDRMTSETDFLRI